MTEDVRALIDMTYSGILRIDPSGLVWRLQKKHKEWDGYRACKPHLLGHETTNGYIRVGIRDSEGVNRKAFAHRLVFMFFNGDIPEGLTVNHKNGEKQDNRIENLELMTPVQQMRHAREVLGRKMGAKKGSQHWKKRKDLKLTEQDYLDIQKSDVPAKELAKKYGVTATRIQQVRLRPYMEE
jgi:hypothetical protein